MELARVFSVSLRPVKKVRQAIIVELYRALEGLPALTVAGKRLYSGLWQRTILSFMRYNPRATFLFEIYTTN